MTAAEAIKILELAKPSDKPWKRNPNITERQAHDIVMKHMKSCKPDFVLDSWMVRRVRTVTKLKKAQLEVRATIAKVFTFASSSGSGSYETLVYTDGTHSCACPGWTRRVAADGSRSCKHTRYVDQGIAVENCISFHDYTEAPAAVAVKPTKSNATQKQEVHIRQLGERKFHLE